MDEILRKYQARGSYRQKTIFINYLKRRLAKSGYDKEIEINEYRVRFFRTRNIIVGNPDEAEIFITAHYDTSSISPISFLLAPTEPILWIIDKILFLVKVFLLAGIIATAIAWISNSISLGIYSFLGVLLVIVFQSVFGIKNWNTANDNTSGVVTLTKILERIPEEQRKKVCAIFFDNEEIGALGSKKVSQIMPNINTKLLINFDCVGEGNNIVSLAKGKAMRDKYYELLNKTFVECSKTYDVKCFSEKLNNVYSSSDHNNFDKGVAIYALKSSLGRMYVKWTHTLLDKKCREENINFLTDAMSMFIQRVNNAE